MAQGKPSTARRREVRKTLPKPGPAWQGWLRRRDVGYAALYVAIFTLVGGLVAISHSRRTPYFFGQTVTEPVVARADFKTIDEVETEAKRRQNRNEADPVYTANSNFLRDLRERIDGLMRFTDYATFDEVPKDEAQKYGLTKSAFTTLKGYTVNNTQMEEWDTTVEGFIQRFFSTPILRPTDYESAAKTGIVIVHPNPRQGQRPEQAVTVGMINLADKEAIREKLSGRQSPVEFLPESLRSIVINLVMENLQQTYMPNPDLTQQARDYAYAHTEPVSLHVETGKVIIDRGQKLTERDLQMLEAERRAYEQWLRLPLSRRAENDPGRGVLLLNYRPLLADAGLAGAILLIAVGLWLYIFHYYPRVAVNPMRGLAVTALLLLCQAMAVGASELMPAAQYAFATLPTLLAVMSLAIVYDRRFALFVGGLHVLLILVSLQLPIVFAITLLSGCAVAAAQLGDIRSRSKIVVTGLDAGIAMGAATFVVGLTARHLDIAGMWTILLRDCGLAVASGFATGLFVQGILPLIERVFRVTTAMTLKELNDASHPLLQRLAQDAPGTYQHSLRLADITESAADAIGGDGLLCRVGAMYHDIGKINKPLYFIENQGGGPNKHAKLSPAMSLLIIVGHVKDGIEMAREYGLPPILRHFIESHHGTTLVEFFYHAAKKQKQEADQPAPSEFEFRYPGPKPQTKEAAIMLLCDGIEAAARTIEEPTPIRLEQLTHTIAMKRLMDGQFDDCALTLQDLARAEAAIVKTLCAIYHARVKYPDGKASSPSRATAPAEPQPAAKAQTA